MRSVLCIILVMLMLSGCAIIHAPQTTTPSTVPISDLPTIPTTAPTTEPATMPVTEPTEEPTEPPNPLQLLLDSMSVEEKVGQIFLARAPKTDDVADISTYHLGGYMLFDRNFKSYTPDEVRTIHESYQNAAKIPLLLAVDEEGDVITRVSYYKQFREEPFPYPRQLFEAGGMEAILATEKEKIDLLSSLGLNVVLGPVCDVTTDPEAFMYDRSLGQDPKVTGQYITSMVRLMAQNRFGSVLKHFPGYGNNADTHIGIARDDRSLEELEAVDLVPFRSGIAAGAQAIMISHTLINSLDPELPASLSPKVIGYLRNEMGFSGVVITDDLIMKAITDQYGNEEAAILAVLAGNDLLCSSEYRIQYAAVLEAVNSGRIPMEILDAAVLRVLQWKHHLGLLG